MLGQLILIFIIILLVLGVIFFFNSPTKPTENKPSQEENLWEYQKEQAKKESQAEQNQEWFNQKRWLTDKEIDWATERLEQSDKFKTLPAYQFHYAAATKGTTEAQTQLAFPELLNELTSFVGDLVFIPVNNPDFHWSLLVYETKSQTFYHYDTLKGANYDYVQPLVSELLQQIHQHNNLKLSDYLIPQHSIQQKNTWDCGIAAIAIIERIIEQYPTLTAQQYVGNLSLGEFDFPKKRRKLRNQYLQESE